MSKRKLIFYDDARHYHFYIFEPPMRLEEATATINAVAGTGVDTFVWGFGIGPTVFHDSRCADLFAAHLEVIDDVASWRAYENAKALIARDLDPLNVMLDRAHEVGMDFFGSLRLTHSSDPAAADSAHNWQFKIDHPEWVLQGNDADPGRKNSFNWIHPEVRAERFAIAEETVTRYDVDGLEIDLTFGPYYFEVDEVAENMHVLTDFLRTLKKVVNEAAARRGRTIELGARLFPSLKANNEAGFDIQTWFEEGLLDFAVPNVYAQLPIDPDFPFEWMIAMAQPNGCKVYPAMGPMLGESSDYAGLEYYRAAAAAYWRRGADALYLPWYPWPVASEQRQILTEIGDPDVLSRKPKRYCVAPKQESSVAFGYEAQLPIPLTVGADVSPTTVNMFVADDPLLTVSTLTLKLAESTSHDVMTVTLNGNELSTVDATYTPYGYNYSTIEFCLQPGTLREGENQISVSLLSQPAILTSTVVLKSVEIGVDYVTTKQP